MDGDVTHPGETEDIGPAGDIRDDPPEEKKTSGSQIRQRRPQEGCIIGGGSSTEADGSKHDTAPDDAPQKNISEAGNAQAKSPSVPAAPPGGDTEQGPTDQQGKKVTGVTSGSVASGSSAEDEKRESKGDSPSSHKAPPSPDQCTVPKKDEEDSNQFENIEDIGPAGDIRDDPPEEKKTSGSQIRQRRPQEGCIIGGGSSTEADGSKHDTAPDDAPQKNISEAGNAQAKSPSVPAAPPGGDTEQGPTDQQGKKVTGVTSGSVASGSSAEDEKRESKGDSPSSHKAPPSPDQCTVPKKDEEDSNQFENIEDIGPAGDIRDDPPEEKKTSGSQIRQRRPQEGCIIGGGSSTEADGSKHDTAPDDAPQKNISEAGNAQAKSPSVPAAPPGGDTEQGPTDQQGKKVTGVTSGSVASGSSAEDEKRESKGDSPSSHKAPPSPDQCTVPKKDEEDSNQFENIEDIGPAGDIRDDPPEEKKTSGSQIRQRRPQEGCIIGGGSSTEADGSKHDTDGKAEADAGESSSLRTAKFWIPAWLIALLLVTGVIYLCWPSSSKPPETEENLSLQVLRKHLTEMESSFPGQRKEVWRRSKILLEKHLQSAQPTEPVSMILTAGRGAEMTLHCLANRLATAYSSALNSSVLHINGLSKTSQDSDQVKLDIDKVLKGAFEGDKRAAVIHRFEELPPASTLIFYKYCDHENAAYKEVSLIFTVLLQEDELSSVLGLGEVEEKVRDHIEDKFLTSAQPATFNQMDPDKWSGLWSRISHLILPVTAVKSHEELGCDSS